MKEAPQYLKTNDMAKLIGYSKDYLLKYRGVLFFEGTHFFTKDNRTNWKVDSIIAWIENKNMSDKAKSILDMLS